MRRDRIHIRCERCGNAMRVERRAYDPDEAAEVTVTPCNICDTGDFEAVVYFRSNGTEVLPYERRENQ